MYGRGLFFVVYKQIKMLLHDLSWIPIFVRSFISLVFEIRLSELDNKKKNFENSLFNYLLCDLSHFLGTCFFEDTGQTDMSKMGSD